MTQRFTALADVLQYLNDAGYKLAKSTLYKHKGEGKLRPQKDGSFARADVDRYARTFLKNAFGQTDIEEDAQLQREKLEAEARKAKAQAVHWELKTQIDSGQYIDRALFDGELAARAAIFKSDLENFFRSAAGEIIHKVNGDQQLAPDLIDFMLERLEVFMGLRLDSGQSY